VAPPPDGGKTWSDWGQAFAAACARQAKVERLSYRSRDGEKILFRDLVAHHYLPSISHAAPNTRKNTASHLGDGSGVPVRNGHYARRAARRQLLFAFRRRADRRDRADLTLDCGLRYEEVTALRSVDVVDGDARNANHLWIRQAVTWAGRECTGLEEPWSIGHTKGKRFRKVAVSAPVFDRPRLDIDTHQRTEQALIFDYALLRAEHAQKKLRDGHVRCLQPVPA